MSETPKLDRNGRRADRPPAWCFICSTAHAWAEVCPRVPPSDRSTRYAIKRRKP